jgi:pyridoxine kinase
MAADLAGSAKVGEVGAVLVGYLGSVGQIGSLAGLVAALKQRNPAARFLYDPNIGDNGALFQPAVLAAEARDRLLPLADIVTPNRFELGWLTGAPVADDGIGAAAAHLGPREVAVTSATVSPQEIGMVLIADGATTVARQAVVAGSPKGTGDLFAALYLGHRLDGRPAIEAMQRAASAVARLVRRAAETGADELPLAEGADDLFGDPEDVVIGSGR